jgi:uncharacterized protein YjbI with pentapeptide repeats
MFMHRQTSAATLRFACTVTVCLVLLAPARAENPDHVKQFRDTGKCAGCDLRDAKLDATVAEFGDLRNADLRNASLYRANLRAADLTGALFTGANLSGADLRNSKGADLLGATTDERTKCPTGEAGPCK